MLWAAGHADRHLVGLDTEQKGDGKEAGWGGGGLDEDGEKEGGLCRIV